MSWQELTQQPGALAAGGVVTAAVIGLVGSMIGLILGRKKRPDRLREALVTDAALLEVLPKGSQAYQVVRESIEHTASHFALERRRQANDYYALLTLALPFIVFGTIFVSLGTGWRPVWIGLVAGYLLGRLQRWFLAFVRSERTAAGLEPLQHGISTIKVNALGDRLREWRGTRRVRPRSPGTEDEPGRLPD